MNSLGKQFFNYYQRDIQEILFAIKYTLIAAYQIVKPKKELDPDMLLANVFLQLGCGYMYESGESITEELAEFILYPVCHIRNDPDMLVVFGDSENKMLEILRGSINYTLGDAKNSAFIESVLYLLDGYDKATTLSTREKFINLT